MILDDKEDQTAMGDSDNAVRSAPDVNNPPAFESAAIDREVREDTTSGGNVGDAVMATDPDGDSLTYEITGGADMDKFGNTGPQITVGSAELDYEDGQSTFEVELTATDPFGMSGSTTVTITVTDFNEAPDFTAEDPDDYAENGEGAVATYTASDPEGTDIIWSTGGTDGNLFTLDGGVLMFKRLSQLRGPEGLGPPGRRRRRHGRRPHEQRLRPQCEGHGDCAGRR